MNKRPFKPYEDYSIEKQQKMPLAYDFLPLTGYQERYHPDAQCYWLRMEVEETVDGLADGLETEIPNVGVIYQDDKKSIPRVAIAGDRTPFDRSEAPFGLMSLKDLCKAFYQHSTLQNFTIREIGMVYSVPAGLKSDPLFEGATKIAHEMRSRGNQGRNFRQKTGINTFDPYQAMKQELEERGRNVEPLEKRLRGHLITRGVIADNGINHWDMARRGRLGQVLQDIHYRDYRWSQSRDFTRDVGTPFELYSGVGQSLGGRMYELTKYDGIMTA